MSNSYQFPPHQLDLRLITETLQTSYNLGCDVDEKSMEKLLYLMIDGLCEVHFKYRKYEHFFVVNLITQDSNGHAYEYSILIKKAVAVPTSK